MLSFHWAKESIYCKTRHFSLTLQRKEPKTLCAVFILNHTSCKTMKGCLMLVLLPVLLPLGWIKIILDEKLNSYEPKQQVYGSKHHD